MDAHTSLRRRVGGTPLLRAKSLGDKVGLKRLHLKLEGANPTGTQKDRIALLEASDAVAHAKNGMTVGSCGNFGVAIAHAAHVHEIPCHVFVPAEFRGERIDLMGDLEATVHRVEGTYEDAVQASRAFAEQENMHDANPGGPSTIRTLVGYSRIATEIVDRLGAAPKAVGVPIGNGSTLAGIHMGFRNAWAAEKTTGMPKIFGGSSTQNNPVSVAFHRGLDRCVPLDPHSIEETEVNEPLVNWDALDGTACLTAVLDSQGAAHGFDDDTLMELHAALVEDGYDAHPASLAAVAALQVAREEGHLDADDIVVAVLTSGRPTVQVETIDRPKDMDQFIKRLSKDLGRFGDPKNEMLEAIETAFTKGYVLEARDQEDVLGHVVLTPMELSEFFPKYHLSYIAVSANARGRGVGTVLLEAAIRITEGDVSLHVETDNENAIKLYEKFGFQRKYYRMIYKGPATTTDTAAGSGWNNVTVEAAP